MHLPLTDWQFYVVTILAALGVWAIVRPFVVRRRRACSGCSGEVTPTRETPLTVGGRAVHRSSSA